MIVKTERKPRTKSVKKVSCDDEQEDEDAENMDPIALQKNRRKSGPRRISRRESIFSQNED